MTDPDVVLENAPEFGHNFLWRSMLRQREYLVTNRTLVHRWLASDRNSDDQVGFLAHEKPGSQFHPVGPDEQPPSSKVEFLCTVIQGTCVVYLLQALREWRRFSRPDGSRWHSA